MFWRQLYNSFPRDWSCKLRLRPPLLKKGEWIGLFEEDDSRLLSIVLKLLASRGDINEGVVTTFHRPLDIVFYIVGTQSHMLNNEDQLIQYMKPLSHQALQLVETLDNTQVLTWCIRRMRVILLFKGKNESKHTKLLYYIKEPLEFARSCKHRTIIIGSALFFLMRQR